MALQDDSFWMRVAIDVAAEANTPFGAVLVDEEGQHVAGFNSTKLDGATAHAEMNVVRKMDQLDYDNAEDLILYTTVEPCPMCMGAVIWAGIGSVKYGLSIDEVTEFTKQIKLPSTELAKRSWRSILITGGVEKEKCFELWK
ncbi:MAG: nucleoside deaminase [Bacteroidota bacterium]